MPSTYTVNLGIEKPATGEQSGTWGDTTNVNFDILDQAVNGAARVTLTSAGSSGSPNTLAITNGATSDGRNKWVEFYSSSDLGGNVFVQLDPNDAEKLVFVRNSLGGSQSVILFQGTYDAGRDLEIPAGMDMVVKFDGGGATATTTNVFQQLRTEALNIAGDGATVTGIKDEDNMASNSATKLATQQSIKAYVDAQVGTVDTLAEILANGNTTGGTNISITSGDKIVTGSNDNLVLEPGGTGNVNISADTLSVTGAEGESAALVLNADEADDNPDTWRIVSNTGNTLGIENQISGSTVAHLTITPNATVANSTFAVAGTVTSAGLTVDSAGTIQLTKNTTAAGDSLGIIEFHDEDGTTTADAGKFQLQAFRGGDKDAPDFKLIGADSTGVLRDRLQVEGTGDITFYDTDGTTASFVYDVSAGTTFNEAGADRDFRVESNGKSNMFVIDGGTNRIGVGTSSPAAIFDVKSDGAVVTTLRGTSSSIAYLDITNYATSAVGAGSGIEFRANSSVQERQVGFITSQWTDNTDASRDSRMDFDININGGTTKALRLGTSEITVNEGGHDTDFRVEGNNHTHAIFLQASSDRVGINESSPDTILHISDSTAPTIRITNTDTTVSSGQTLSEIQFEGSDASTAADGIRAKVTALSGGIGGFTSLQFFTAGENTQTLTRGLDIHPNRATFNEDGGDVDFRVEGADDPYMIFVDAFNNRVGINISNPQARLSVNEDNALGSTLGDYKRLVRLEQETGNQQYLDMIAIRTSAGSDWTTQGIRLQSSVDSTEQAYIQWNGANTQNGLEFGTGGGSGGYLDASIKPRISIKSATEVVFNEGGEDYNFRVEGASNKTHGLFYDAGQNQTFFGGSTSPTATGFVSLGGIKFSNGSAGGGKFLSWDNEGGTGSQSLIGYWYDGSSYRNRIRIAGDTLETVVNGSGDNIDFRVQSDSNANMLFVDGGVSQIGVGMVPDQSWGSNSHGINFGINTADAGWLGWQQIAGADNFNMMWNVYHDNSNFRYASNNPAAKYTQNSTSHTFSHAVNGSADAVISFVENLRMNSTEAAFNEAGANLDFRVESDSETHALFVDAGEDQVKINTSASLYTGTQKGGLQVRGGGGGPHVLVLKNLDTSGGANMVRFTDGSGDTCGEINSNATNNTTSYGTSSDYRLKENVSAVSNAIDKVKLLQPKTYNFISDPENTPQDGFLAHELAEVIPNAVTGEKDDVNEDNSIKSQQVDYGQLTPLLTAALQEAITKIETLEARITALENA